MPAAGRPNLFAGPHVDRLKLRRGDLEAIDAALRCGRAALLPVWRSRCPLVREPAPRALLLEAGAAPVDLARVEELILLGEFRGRIVLACELEAEAEPSLGPGTEFADLRAIAGLLSHEDAGLLAYARAMVAFRGGHRYCGSCGAPTRTGQSGHVMVCTRGSCAAESFPRLDPAVIVLVQDGERALLGRQSVWPPGRYSTIAGFVEPGESLEDAVRREVLEETGIEVAGIRYHSSQPWPFPRSLMLGFHAEAATTAITLGDGELEDARWFTRAELASGTPRLPLGGSIAWRLIQDWYDTGAARPLAAEASVRGWGQ
ncbi:MAG: NAD(+) diphosphatase [Gammaproteobacteria bacterium]|nr:NAD(+) diphosphatase [Gammaproteobacteria bacterium]